MHIVCPHCTTSYAIDPAKLGDSRPDRALFPLQGSLAGACRGRDPDRGPCRGDDGRGEASRPTIWPTIPAGADRGRAGDAGRRQPADRRRRCPTAEDPIPSRRTRNADAEVAPRKGRKASKRSFGAPPPEAAEGADRAAPAGPGRHDQIGVHRLDRLRGVGALALALLIWRADVVRLLPQTATFYRWSASK